MQKTKIYTLCGKSDLNMALKSISSLHAYSIAPLRHIVLSDGTICGENNKFTDHGICAEIISKEYADDIVMPIIRSLPNVIKYRKNNPLIRKAIDIPLLCDVKTINMADTDVFAIRPFSEMFEVDRDIAFNREHRIGTSASFRNLMLYCREYPLAFQINSGLYQLNKMRYDVEKIEFILKEFPYFPGTGFLHEQTIWAAFSGAQTGCARFFSKRNVQVVTQRTDLSCEELAILHFIRPSRYRLRELENLNVNNSDVTIKTENVRSIRQSDVILDRIKFRFLGG